VAPINAPHLLFYRCKDHNSSWSRLHGCVHVAVMAGPLYVIVEYAPHGNLRDFLREHRAVCDGWSDDVEHRRNLLLPALRYKDLLSFAFQVARGLEYMSSQMVNATNRMLYYYARTRT